MLPLLACHAPYGCLESKQTKKVNKNYSWLLAGHPAGGSLKKSLPGPTYPRCMSHDSFYYKKIQYKMKICNAKVVNNEFFDEFFSYIFCHCAIAECISWMFFWEAVAHCKYQKKVVVSTANIIIIFSSCEVLA